MGYARFDGNEEEIMEAFHRDTEIDPEEVNHDYPFQIKALLRKKMIEKVGNKLRITERGENAIMQQIRTGRYWLAPLHPTKYKEPSAKIRVPREYGGYFS